MIRIELVEGESGSTIEFNHVFAVRKEGFVGRIAPGRERESQGDDPAKRPCAQRFECLKYKRKKQYRRTLGHRQGFSEVLIKDIVTN